MLKKNSFEHIMQSTKWARLSQFALAICIFCYAALTPSPTFMGQHTDVSMHFMGNILLCLSAWLAFWERLSALKLLLFLLPFSLAIELAQYFSPGRTVDVKDMMVNITGLCVGMLIGYSCRRIANYFFTE